MKFALHTHAGEAFSTVVDICKQVLSTPIEPTDDLYYPLMIGLHTAYGRSFTNCHGFGKLEADSLVPNEFKELHELMMKHRHKIYAHTDQCMSGHSLFNRHLRR